jgi:hypothetical protein
LIAGNFIDSNMTRACGGGVYGANANPLIVNNIIRHNRALYGGGGLAFGHASSGRVFNNVIYVNWSAQNGGGIHSYDSSHPIVANCIFWADSAQSNPEINIDGGTIAVSYSDILGGYTGNGNININPFFCNAVQSDFRLMSTACGDSADSPCIDSGNPNILDSLLNCAWGLGTTRGDIGAFGGGDSTTQGINEPLPIIPDKIILTQNYPNPFNASTIIKFSLPHEANVSLEVYDILGRKVVSLVEAKLAAGSHEVTWSAADLPSGLYFYRLKAGDFTQTRKMMLVK